MASFEFTNKKETKSMLSAWVIGTVFWDAEGCNFWNPGKPQILLLVSYTTQASSRISR
jgi:hypothetical protein